MNIFYHRSVFQPFFSKIVLVGEKTQINKTAQASREELTAGAQVRVFGTKNSDGTITAQNIQLNPLTMGTATPSSSQ